MATEKMYEAAFRYKKTKLWKTVFDSELFAVRFSDGETGYCCVMGMAGDEIALTVYVGDEGFQSFRDIELREGLNLSSPDIASLTDMNRAFRLSCLRCSFNNRAEVDADEAEEARLYAKAHEIQLRAPRSFPRFERYRRYRLPGKICAPEDERRICEALDAASALAGMLEGRRKAELGLVPVDEDTEALPLLLPGADGYRLESVNVPERWEEEWREVAETDAGSVEEVRKLRKKGVYDCEVVRLPGMIEEWEVDEDDPPYYPAVLLCADSKSGLVVATAPVSDYDARPEALRDAFVETLLKNQECPRAVKARDEQARVLLEDFCIKTGVLLSVDNEMPALDEAKAEMFRGLQALDEEEFLEDEDEEDDGGEDFLFGEPDGGNVDMEEVISLAMDELSRMTDADLRRLPRETVRQILEMAPFGFVPKELQLRLRRLLNK